MTATKRASTRTLYSTPDGGTVRRTVLPGGLRIITEQVPGALSASVGIWVGVGSVDETPSQTGGAHYLEHLVFKGTRSRTALQIASTIEGVGGDMNAFTSKEHTCFYATVLPRDVPLAIDLISDVVLNPTMHSHDVEIERKVVLEELAMRDDDPGDLVHDIFATVLFGNQALGRPIIGDAAKLKSIGRRNISSLYRKYYRPQNMVVAVAGKIEHAQVVKLVRAAFAEALSNGSPQQLRRPAGTAARNGTSIEVLNRRTEQAHIVIGMPAFSRFDDRRFALSILEIALGGGMSSRLFQEIRERRALAYSVYAFSSLFADDGMFGVYAGTAPGNAREVISLVRQQFAEIAAHGLSDEQIERAKGQVRGGLVLGLEDMTSRMGRLGRSELGYGDHVAIDWLIDHIDSVSAQQVAELAAELLAQPQSLAVVGPFRRGSFDKVMA